MHQRGRKSAAALSVVAQAETPSRPQAPANLMPEAAAEWRAIVDRMPADWFTRETHGLLAAYCKHIVSARHVGQLIEAERAAGALDLVRYDKLLRMQERESRAMSSLGTRMRLTQGSRLKAETAASRAAK